MGEEELWGHMGLAVNPGSPHWSHETWTGDSASMSHSCPLCEMDMIATACAGENTPFLRGLLIAVWNEFERQSDAEKV